MANRMQSYRIDVRRRVLETLTVIAPDEPIAIEFIEIIISGDSLIGGPMDLVMENLSLAPLVAEAGLNMAAATNAIKVDLERNVVQISAEVQEQIRAYLAAFKPTKQARKREKYHLSDIGADLLAEMHHHASYLPGHAELDLALFVPHLCKIITNEVDRLDGDWGPAQALATLWLLNAHGVVPAQVLNSQTESLIGAIVPYASGYDWAGGWMLVQAVDEMIDSNSGIARKYGAQLLDLADVVMQNNSAEVEEKHVRAIQELRHKLAKK